MLQSAIKQNRVMTIEQGRSGGKADRGCLGFSPGQSRQFLIFPRSLARFAGSSVVAINYDLLKQGDAQAPSRSVLEATAIQKKEKAADDRKTQPTSPTKIIPFTSSAPPPPPEPVEPAQDLQSELQNAIDLLAKGRRSAALNLLKRIVKDLRQSSESSKESERKMRPLWKGAISFGLVTIPVSLYPAIAREELKFRMLRKSDLSPINYKRVAETDGKEVPWDQIVKGYEHEKGKYIVLKEEDFARVDVEATQTVDIINFVALKDVDPLLFYKPYYLEVGKGGQKAYVLLRDALVEAGRIAIAKVVIRARQHLAAVKPQNSGLMLELMHFPDELIDASQFKAPTLKSVGKSEMRMALQLVEEHVNGLEA